VDIFKSKTHNIGYQIRLKFQVTQHSRDILLMNSFIKYLGCGVLREYSNRPAVDFVVTKFSDIHSKIIPLFTNYPLQGIKSLDFADFCQIALFIKNNDHLTQEGFEKIQNIKSGMNTGRV
jgi:hypothetical protein